VALALAPLCGAGLLMRSFVSLLDVAPGFASEHRLSMSFLAPRARYPGASEIAALAARIRESLQHAPGISQAGLAQSIPFSGGARWLQAFTRENPRGTDSFAQLPLVRYTVVTPGYFEAMGIGLEAGRYPSDQETNAPVVVINEALARQQFAGENAVGRPVWVGHADALKDAAPRTVIGVVRDIHMYALDRAPDPAAWVPISQQALSAAPSVDVWRSLYLVVESRIGPDATLAAVRDRIRGVDPDLALTDIASMDRRVSDSLWRQRFSGSVISAFGLAALGIALIGVFGVTSYLAMMRSREFGIRMAVGARPSDISQLVVRESVPQIVLGIATGLAAAWALARVLQGLLYGVTPGDPWTYAGASAVLGGVALAACLIPAMRAARSDPMRALRQE
jgi:predicted permease